MKELVKVLALIAAGVASAPGWAARPLVGLPHHEYSALLVEIPQLEWRDSDDGDGLAWEGGFSWGGDLNKLVVESEGERADGETREHEVSAWYQRAWQANWALEAGLREDTQPGNPRTTWLSAGVSGEAPGFIETRATLYFSEYDQSALRLEFAKEILFTQRLVLEPELELNLFRDDDPEAGVASGLASSEFELRLQYEITREFAPYAAVVFERLHGDTADLHDEDTERALALGVSIWF